MQNLQNNVDEFSLNTQVLKDIFAYARPLGHREKRGNLNLGFGFLYYGLVRAIRPRHVLVIGSGFGFSVVCLALGLKDNGKGELTFLDPSFSVFKDGPFKTVGGTGQWDDPDKVRARFECFGLGGLITHHKCTSREFFDGGARAAVSPIDLAFIDGSHAFEDVRYDFESVVRRARKNSYVLLHDTNIYLREMIRHAGVKRWLKHIKRDPDSFEIIDFPFASGVAVVRIKQAEARCCS